MRIILALFLLLLLSLNAYARLSQADAVEIAKKQGQVLSVQSESKQGREVFRIKILTPQGEVKVIYLDAETGDKR